MSAGPSVDPGITKFQRYNCTTTSVQEISFTWTIELFSFLVKSHKELKSSPFSAGDSKTRWRLTLHLNNTDEESRDYLSLELTLISCRKSEKLPVLSQFVVLNAQKEREHIMVSDNITEFSKNISWWCPKFIKKDFLLDENNGLLPDDKLTIMAEIRILRNVKSIPGHIRSECKHDWPERLFMNKRFSDVTIAVDGKEIQAHKCILAEESCVFEAMFNTNMRERINNVVQIEDMNYTTFQEMLRFIYTGKVEDDHQITDLLKAAEKYQLKKLKTWCEKELISNVRIENATEILVLADLYNADQLKAQTLEMIKRHLTDVMDSEGYKAMENSHPRLVIEILHFAKAKRVKRS